MTALVGIAWVDKNLVILFVPAVDAVPIEQKL